jgi:hypothetical protein
MSKFKNIVSMSSFASRAVAVLVVVTSAVAGTLLATAALASNGNAHRSRGKTGISVFSHQPRGLARIATSGALNPPPGAILAAVVGHNEVYAWHHSSSEDCVMNLHVGGAGGAVCGQGSKVEEQGTVGIFQEGEGATAPNSPATLRVVALVPNGVESVVFTDRDGSSQDVDVTNNVVELEDINIASVSYTLPSGASHTTNVGAIVDHSVRQPGPPGSSRKVEE